ncbi:MAG: TetR/AcrR family transcriptional regulator [Spirochaetaceae bacterium]|nr:TetR/AcrR family transcriptional regulator [Spirochaetaceae bacterium]
MEPVKKKYHYPADLKQDLLEKGIQLIREKGIDGLTLKSLAGSLGVTSAAMYHHYPDKTALFVAIVERRAVELYQQLNEKVVAVHKDDVAQLLIKSAEVFYDFCAENTEFLALIMGDAIRSWDEYPAINEKVQNVFGILEKAIVQGQQSGILRDGNPYNLMMVLFSGTLGMANIMFNSKTALPAQIVGDARQAFSDVIHGSLNMIRK